MAQRGSSEGKLLSQQRAKEIIAGLKKISTPIFLNIPDGKLGEEVEHKKIIKENILNIMPDLIITHSQMIIILIIGHYQH